MKLLLLSSSRAQNSAYMAPNLAWIAQHLQGINNVVFIPYADVSGNYDGYVNKVQQALASLPLTVNGLHQFSCAKTAITEAQAVMVGGGNTFALLHKLYQLDVLTTLRQRVCSGLPYIGWSAGANIAGASISTTNDMPIIEPPSFRALQCLNLQLNPHYTDFVPADFHGETRDMRLAEFMTLQPQMPIIGLPEGTALQYINKQITVLGAAGAFWFLAGQKTPLTGNALLPQDYQALLTSP
ncbi:dipeptidase PepE [Alishewanella tabrizica]|uniref:Peptidase E n=1 Tax=Alishewanella tabrizica TaxID=671278 RepID=A0ABQ2WLX4_9ALTE|nr:dipeptidase PepE [Alishewanella tabrizica]GGW58027.1 peptidase E [Alishewanella tabrizica]